MNHSEIEKTLLFQEERKRPVNIVFHPEDVTIDEERQSIPFFYNVFIVLIVTNGFEVLLKSSSKKAKLSRQARQHYRLVSSQGAQAGQVHAAEHR